MRKFSLLEMLVVIAVIAILVSLLLPSLSKARLVATKAVCLSNEKQIYTLLQQNIRNTDGYFLYDDDLVAGHGSWPWDVTKGDFRSLGITEEPNKDLWVCPLNEEQRVDSIWNYSKNTNIHITGYMFMHERPTSPMRQNDDLWTGKVMLVDNPDEKVLLSDIVIDNHSLKSNSSGNKYRTSHVKMGIYDANSAYVDGHAKLRRWTTLRNRFEKFWW
ncbi:MAG: prepilin-type N-terminal cleavage/methylation domain-containing protein [Lentisphaeraceae bacterium]|nr:prepilin-type N-terminal cleavage/methylation domain-containing protein [Lentisphaeraceae bacterium]